MATSQTVRNQTVWTLLSKDGGTRAEFVPAWGGIGSSLTVPSATGAREVLFRHDFFWDPDTDKTRGGSPFLFPACGRIERDGHTGRYLYEGQLYSMTIHGFASRMPWDVIESSRDEELTMRLTDTEETRKAFPFPFEILMTHRVEPGVLISRHTVRNMGTRPMPYSMGFHPYLLTPPAAAGKERVQVNFAARRRLIYNDRLTDIVGHEAARTMPLSVLDPRINEAIHEVKSGTCARMTFPDGFEVQVEAGGEPADLYRYLQTYTMADKPFFCIEPWTGHPNALNTAGGVRWLAPGASETGYFLIRSTLSTENK